MTRKIIRRSAAVLTAVLFALPVCAADYRDQFTDVAKTAWYYNDVADAYANGLISGKSDTEFKPDGTLTVAEAVKLAVVCHQTLVSGKVSPLSPSGENWYDPYVTYAKDNGIVTEDEDYTAPATRGKIAVLFSRAMISSGTDCPEVNPIAFGNLSDVDVSAWYSGAVYRLYRWGILTGDGTSVKPESPVKRSEISAVVMRMIDASRRVDLDKTNGEKLPQAPTVTPPADNTGASSGTGSGSTSAPDVMSSLTLYAGSTDKKAFTGITAAAGDFAVTDGVSYQNASYSMDLLNSVILENDNISFRLYTGSGYEALGIVRGWLN